MHVLVKLFFRKLKGSHLHITVSYSELSSEALRVPAKKVSDGDEM